MKSIVPAIKTVFALRPYALIGGISFVVFLIFYLFTLPSSFTGGRIGLMALRYLDLRLSVFSVVMAALMGLIVPFAVYLFRQGLGASKASATGGLAVGLLTPILCCSPVLPIAISFVAGVFPSLVGSFGWGLQGFIATHQSELFLAAIVLLVLALYQNARRVQAGVACIAIHGTRSDAGGKRSPDSLDNA